MVRAAFFFFLSLMTSFVFHVTALASADDLKPLREALSRLQKSKRVELSLEKVVKSEILGTETKHQAKAHLQGSLFRFETPEPEKSLIVYDGQILWVVQYPPKGSEMKTQVGRTKVDGKIKDQLILSELISKGRLLDSFSVVRSGDRKGLSVFSGKPKKSMQNLKSVEVEIGQGELKSLSYVDDVGNTTLLNIENVKTFETKKAELFKYVPEKDAQVTNL